MKKGNVQIRKTDSVHWPWVGAAFLWQISEIVGHTNSFSFGELENLIMWYKTQLSSVPTSVRRGFSLVSFFSPERFYIHSDSKENYAVNTKKISDRSKKKFWIKDLTLDYNSFEIRHLKILAGLKVTYIGIWNLKSVIWKFWRGNCDLIFNWNALSWFPYLTYEREIQRFLHCWPDSSKWFEILSEGAFQIFISMKHPCNNT